MNNKHKSCGERPISPNLPGLIVLSKSIFFVTALNTLDHRGGGAGSSQPPDISE